MYRLLDTRFYSLPDVLLYFPHSSFVSLMSAKCLVKGWRPSAIHARMRASLADASSPCLVSHLLSMHLASLYCSAAIFPTRDASIDEELDASFSESSREAPNSGATCAAGAPGVWRTFVRWDTNRNLEQEERTMLARVEES